VPAGLDLRAHLLDARRFASRLRRELRGGGLARHAGRIRRARLSAAYSKAQANGTNRRQYGNWGVTAKKDADEFRVYLADQTRCPGIEDARKVTNGTKHFSPSKKISTGSHHGDFDRADFSADDFSAELAAAEFPASRCRVKNWIPLQ
jgi:hypothetical protein